MPTAVSEPTSLRIGRRATLISRLDASLFAPPREAHKRARQKGPPKLHTHDPGARWKSLTLPRWYGSPKKKTLEIISDTAIWYRTPTKAMGAGPRRRAGTAGILLHRHRHGPRSSRPSCGRSRSRSRNCAPISGSKHNASDAAITTPVLCGLYSLVCLWAEEVLTTNHPSYAAAWYEKTSFTFSDAIAAIRCELWLGNNLSRSSPGKPHNAARQNKAHALHALLRHVMHKVELRFSSGSAAR